MNRYLKEASKKKVLFVLQSIGFGGSMTSLINLLGFLKKNSNLSIDVLFMDRYGELLEQAKDLAHVLPENAILQSVTPTRDKLLQLRRFDLLIKRCCLALCGKLKNTSTEKLAFKLASKSFSGMYDCVIAYQESIATQFVSEIQADKKIAWVHNDFDNVLCICGGIDAMNKLYSSFDTIVCVSKAGQKNFRDGLTFDPHHIEYVYNTLDTYKIQANALISIDQVLHKDSIVLQKLREKKTIKFVSSGRMVRQKRFDRAILAAKELKSMGVDFYWFIIGDGELFSDMSEMIVSEKLEDCVFLTGGLKNPFPVVNACDIFVLTSDFEAHPMVANEALILGKPVISTDFESASEVVVHEYNGLISKRDPEYIATTCRNLVENKSLFERLKRNAIEFVYQNDDIINKVIRIIGE